MRNQRGDALLQLIVSLGIGSIVLSAAITQWSYTHVFASDLALKNSAQAQAIQVAHLVKHELMGAGSGIPFHSSGFQIGDGSLGTSPLPITVTSNDSITFRSNITGAIAVLTAEYTPGASSLTFTVDSATDFSVGDTLYISNSLQLGSDGLEGVISSKSSNSITIESTYVATAGAVFSSGSTVERVRTIGYSSDGWTVSRTDYTTGSTIVVAENARIEFTYVDDEGTTLNAPLTETQIRDELGGVEVRVRMRGKKPLSDGSLYEEDHSEKVALKNILFSR